MKNLEINTNYMKTFQTQADFLKAFPIKDGIINLEYNSVILLFNLDIPRINIINAQDINALENINAQDINAWDINARDINARDIKAWNIKAWDINAQDISAWNIKDRNINARNIRAHNIDAWNISAQNIIYYAVCFAHTNITCKSIVGTRKNAKHFCLDGQITIEA